jgi:8-oxo-dGTP pyrophosphatase MutT (NUDIX family)
MDQTVQHDSTKPEPQPVVAAIVTSGHGVLLGRRNDGKPPWTFIAGEIEPGESPADAGVREVKEETGLLVAAGQEIGRRVHPATGRMMIYMAARPTHGTDIFVGDRDELAEVRWVPLAEAEELMQPYGMFGPVREHLATTLR